MIAFLILILIFSSAQTISSLSIFGSMLAKIKPQNFIPTILVYASIQLLIILATFYLFSFNQVNFYIARLLTVLTLLSLIFRMNYFQVIPEKRIETIEANNFVIFALLHSFDYILIGMLIKQPYFSEQIFSLLFIVILGSAGLGILMGYYLGNDKRQVLYSLSAVSLTLILIFYL